MPTRPQIKGRLTLLPRAVVLAICLAGPVLAQYGSQQQAAQQRLVPANFNQKIDSQGFQWRIDNYGRVQYGTNNCFGSSFTLTVNGNSFRSRQPMMTPDGSEYVLAGQASNLQVTRRIKIDVKAAAIRYLEVVHNPTGSPVNVNFTINMQVGQSQFQTIVSDTGTPHPTSLGKKDCGVLGYADPNTSQLAVVLYMAGARSKIKPTLQIPNQAQITYTYQVTVGPGKKASILHGAAQRRLPALPTGKALTALFKPFTSRGWTRDLPRDLRRSIANLGGFGFGGWSDIDGLTTLESLDVEPSKSDVLAVGDNTRLHGAAACDGLSVATRYGTAKLSLDKVAAVVGRKHTSRKPRVFLRDGQAFAGDVRVDKLTFTMNSGLSLELGVKELDRLVLHADPKDGRPAEGVVAMLETTEGDRLALLPTPDSRLRATMPWIQRGISLTDIRRLTVAEGEVGHQFLLRDGSRVFAFLDGSPLALDTLAFGQQTLSSLQIRAIVAAADKFANEDDAAEIADPHLLLAGENVLVGGIDLPAIHFVTSGRDIPVPPNQIRLLQNVSVDPFGYPRGKNVFEAELWDGSGISGSIREAVLPVRWGEGVAQVPVGDVLEAHVPTPTVAGNVRRKVAQLIRDLGDPDYATREKAAEALAELGYLAKSQLEEARKQTSDPEVRRRVEKLLEELQE